jgi:hypothetical protein
MQIEIFLEVQTVEFHSNLHNYTCKHMVLNPSIVWISTFTEDANSQSNKRITDITSDKQHYSTVSIG